MSGEKNGNENAYPQGSHSNGLTKREYFAAMALQGCLAQTKTINEPREFLNRAAKVSVSFADALLAALDAPPPK